VERAVSKRKPVFPIRIEEIVPSPSLELFVSATHWIDAWSGRLVDHVDRLARDLADDSVVEKATQVSKKIARRWQMPRWVMAAGILIAIVFAIIVGNQRWRTVERAPTSQPKPIVSVPLAKSLEENHSSGETPTVAATSPPPFEAGTPASTPFTTEQQIRKLPGSVGGDAQFRRLGQEADKAVEIAGKMTLEALPLFQDLIDDVEKLGLSRVRTERKDAARVVSDLFGKAAAQLRLAAAKCEEAAQHHPEPQMKAFMIAKAKGYRLGAQPRELNQQFISVIMEDSASSVDDILPKLQELAGRRDKANQASLDQDNEANEMVKSLKR
jgi:hypothetical protein